MIIYSNVYMLQGDNNEINRAEKSANEILKALNGFTADSAKEILKYCNAKIGENAIIQS